MLDTIVAFYFLSPTSYLWLLICLGIFGGVCGFLLVAEFGE